MSGTSATSGTAGNGGTSGTAAVGATAGVSDFGGSGGAGVAGAIGTSGTAGVLGCEYRGVTHPANSTFSDGCNECTCFDGRVGPCTLQACAGCTYEGEHYLDGAVIPSTDGGCCTCNADEPFEEFECVKSPCDSEQRCQELRELYAAELVGGAMDCDPAAVDSGCMKAVPNALDCGCPVLVNNWNQLSAWRIEWAAHGCDDVITCEACPPPPPMEGYCSPEGRCVVRF